MESKGINEEVDKLMDDLIKTENKKKEENELKSEEKGEQPETLKKSETKTDKVQEGTEILRLFYIIFLLKTYFS